MHQPGRPLSSAVEGNAGKVDFTHLLRVFFVATPFFCLDMTNLHSFRMAAAANTDEEPESMGSVLARRGQACVCSRVSAVWRWTLLSTLCRLPPDQKAFNPLAYSSLLTHSGAFSSSLFFFFLLSVNRDRHLLPLGTSMLPRNRSEQQPAATA